MQSKDYLNLVEEGPTPTIYYHSVACPCRYKSINIQSITIFIFKML